MAVEESTNAVSYHHLVDRLTPPSGSFSIPFPSGAVFTISTPLDEVRCIGATSGVIVLTPSYHRGNDELECGVTVLNGLLEPVELFQS